MATRAEMDAALKQIVVPALRQMGFKGAMPHLRRPRGDTIDLITFQFRSFGGGLVIEVGHCATTGIDHPGGFHIEADKAKTSDLRYRHRIEPEADKGEAWFEYENGPAEPVAERLLARLRDPALWGQVDALPLGWGPR